MSYKLSIAIPSYNRSRILDEILWNVCNQINRFPNECACYVIDNCSTDNTFEIVQKHQKLCPNLFYFKNEENIGLVRNISSAITIPKSSWVWLMGDDDIPMPYAVSNILKDLEGIDDREVSFIMYEGAKVNENNVFVTSFAKRSKAQEPMTVFKNGAEIISVEGIHSIAWLSKLVINRPLWDQNLFDSIYRETDLYTFVNVLLQNAISKTTIHSRKLLVIVTDRGSRAYYFSKTAIARVLEFPEIESIIIRNYGIKKAKKLLKAERVNWISSRLIFVIKMCVFKEAYSLQMHLLKNPISPFWLERFLIRLIYFVCNFKIISNFLKKKYIKSRGGQQFDIANINKIS